MKKEQAEDSWEQMAALCGKQAQGSSRPPFPHGPGLETHKALPRAPSQCCPPHEGPCPTLCLATPAPLTRQKASGRAVSRALWRPWPRAGLGPGCPGPGPGLREEVVVQQRPRDRLPRDRSRGQALGWSRRPRTLPEEALPGGQL